MSDRPTTSSCEPGPTAAQPGVRVVVDFAAGRIVGATGELHRPGDAPAPSDPPHGEAA